MVTFIPEPLPASVDQVVVQVAPDYGDWWRADWGRASLRDLASQDSRELFPLVPGLAGGSFQVAMSPGVRRELTLTIDDWPSTAPSELERLPMRQQQPPPGLSPWWILAVLPLSLVAVGAGIAASSEFYHWVVSGLGFRWEFAEVDAQAMVFIRDAGESGATLRLSGEAISVCVSVPPADGEFADLRQKWRAEAAASKTDTFHVWANVDRDLCRYDWNSRLSDRWTDRQGHVFSGLIYGVGSDDRVASPHRVGARMVVSVLGCEVRDDDPIFPMMDIIVDRTAQSFKASGFKVLKKTQSANRDDLGDAFKESDIVVVCAHARDGSFRFRAQEFGVSEWRALGDPVRCVLMLFLGCGLGDLVSSEEPILLELVNDGVTCVASTRKDQDILLGKDLLSAFCRIWRTGRVVGPTLAEALHMAATQVADAKTGDPILEAIRELDLNAYVIIGTPTLRLEWRWAGRRLWR